MRMNKVLRNIVLIGMAALASCQDFLEPASQSEYVPQLVESLDRMILKTVVFIPCWDCSMMMWPSVKAGMPLRNMRDK